MELAGKHDRASESGESRTSLILSRTRDCNVRAKEKTFCAPHEPQKVLVVELFALPNVPGNPRWVPC